MLRVIGDVHGYYNEYLQLIRDCKYSVQVGDLGLNYKYLRENTNEILWNNHKAIAGNHDNYNKDCEDYFLDQPFALGHYGVHVVDNKEIFYVRGGWSIDRAYRTPNLDWWEDEELSHFQLEEAIRIYKNVKPEIVVTHECPLSVVQYVTNSNFVRLFGYSEGVIKTRTNQALQIMLEYHAPTHYFFGHYHTRKEFQIGKTKFVALDMIRQPLTANCYYDLH